MQTHRDGQKLTDTQKHTDIQTVLAVLGADGLVRQTIS